MGCGMHVISEQVFDFVAFMSVTQPIEATTMIAHTQEARQWGILST